MNLSRSHPTSTSTLTWHVLLEALEPGQVAAWVMEFPECRVVAAEPDAAIAALAVRLNQRLATIQVVPLQLATGKAENPWLQVCGILQDDASFAAWSDRFWADKQQCVDDQVLSVAESLRVM